MNLRSTVLAMLFPVLFLALATPAARADAPPPKVVVSIKPLHALISAVMEGVGEPYLLLPDGASPHVYALKLSDARAIENADAVFWIGEGLETFLHDAIHTLAADAASIEIAELPGIELLEVREGGVWAAHHHHGGEMDHEDEHEDKAAHEDGDHDDEHEHEAAHEEGDHDDHDALRHDMHLWLDPANARRIVAATAEILARIDAERGPLYRANAEAADARLASLDEDLADMLTPVRSQPFIVFHDAYAYLENRYELTARGSIVVDPEQPPGARRIAELRELIAGRGAVCLFSEPQFAPKMVERLAADTGLRTAELDPLGIGIAPGPGAYAKMMRRNARSIRTCLDVTG